MDVIVQKLVRRTNQTVFVKVTEQMDARNEEKIQAMKGIVAEFVPGEDGVQVETQDSAPDTQMNAFKRSNGFAGNRQASSKQRANTSTDDGRITNKQIGLIKARLQERGVSESSFCKKYNIASVEVIPKSDAQWIIKELLANK